MFGCNERVCCVYTTARTYTIDIYYNDILLAQLLDISIENLASFQFFFRNKYRFDLVKLCFKSTLQVLL